MLLVFINTRVIMGVSVNLPIQSFRYEDVLQTVVELLVWLHVAYPQNRWDVNMENKQFLVLVLV